MKIKLPRHAWRTLEYDDHVDARSRLRRSYCRCTRCNRLRRHTWLLLDGGGSKLVGVHYRQQDGLWYYRNPGCGEEAVAERGQLYASVVARFRAGSSARVTNKELAAALLDRPSEELDREVGELIAMRLHHVREEEQT